MAMSRVPLNELTVRVGDSDGLDAAFSTVDILIVHTPP